MKSFFIIGSFLLLILHAPTTKAQAAEEADSALCTQGTMQSPVDLTNVTVQTVPDSEQVFTFYQPSNTTLLNRGHDIALEWTGDAGSIEINGINYRLQQVHWHVPSEHTVDAKRYDLERHAVHVNLDTNETAVIGALYQIGEQDPFLSQLMTNLSYMVETSTNETDPGVIDPSDITSTDGFYRYIGSLTTPPCTEDIVWTVQNKIRSVSQQQVDLLLEAVHGNENARALQAINGREIYLYVPASKETDWSIIFSPERIDWNIIFAPLQYLQKKFFSE